MPRPALTDEQRDETRRSIRKAAARLYAKSGLADISARTIAQEAGVSVGTLYKYFDNLTELMQSLWKEPTTRFLHELEALTDTTPNPRTRLRKILEAYVRFAIENSAVYRGAFLYVRPASHVKPEPVALNQDRLFSIIRNALAEGQKQGLLRSGNLRKMTQLLWAGLHGAIALPSNVDRLALDPPEKLAPQMVNLLMDWLEP